MEVLFQFDGMDMNNEPSTNNFFTLTGRVLQWHFAFFLKRIWRGGKSAYLCSPQTKERVVLTGYGKQNLNEK